MEQSLSCCSIRDALT